MEKKKSANGGSWESLESVVDQECEITVLFCYYNPGECVAEPPYLPINWLHSFYPHYLKNVALTNYPHYVFKFQIPRSSQ